MSLNNAADERVRIQKMNLEGANSGGLGDKSPPAGSRVHQRCYEVPQKLTTFRS